MTGWGGTVEKHHHTYVFQVNQSSRQCRIQTLSLVADVIHQVCLLCSAGSALQNLLHEKCSCSYCASVLPWSASCLHVPVFHPLWNSSSSLWLCRMFWSSSAWPISCRCTTWLSKAASTTRLWSISALIRQHLTIQLWLNCWRSPGWHCFSSRKMKSGKPKRLQRRTLNRLHGNESVGLLFAFRHSWCHLAV